MSQKKGSLWRKLRKVPLFLGGGYLILSANPTPPGTVIGFILIVLGEAWRVWGTGHLRKNEYLAVTGPYAHVKNPLYLGSILISVGFCILADQIYLLAFLTILFCFHYIPYKKKTEGERLRRIFGARYEDYDERVPDYLPRWSPYPGPKAPWRLDCFWRNNEAGILLLILLGIVLILYRPLWRPLL